MHSRAFPCCVRPVSTAAPAAAAPLPPPTLAVSVVVGGLQNPWDLAFTPGGGMVFTERSGPIKFRVAGTAEVGSSPGRLTWWRRARAG